VLKFATVPFVFVCYVLLSLVSKPSTGNAVK
jgi:CDP-diacylglycerol--serine O-phosphatidyltransferase